MRRPVKARLALFATVVAVLAVAGCGEGAESGSDPAALAPPQAPLFIAADVQPTGEAKTNVEELFEAVSDVDTSLGELIVTEIESSAGSSGEELDFEGEIQPWLGERGGLFLQEYDGEEFEGYGVAIQTTDTGATQDFVDKQSAESDEVPEEGSYEGVDYKTEVDDGTTIGIVGDFLVFAEDAETFKEMVDASSGESLADEERYAEAVDAAPAGSLADVYVDVGGLIDQSGGVIDPEAKQFLDSAGIDAAEATAVASLIPSPDRVEIEVSSDLGGENPPSGDASGLLGSLPADSVAAFAATDFGDRIGEALDQIDEDGIPGEIPPGKFKSTLKEAGIDVDRIAASVGDLGVFAEGSSERSIAGAAVLTTKDSKEATNTVSNVGLLLRAIGTPGVTAISGKVSGFSVRSADLGPKPLVVAARGERIAIAYGLLAATRALAPDSANTLADAPAYEAAVSALGGTPISGFVDGPAALELATALIPADDEGFREARPYLTKIDYVAIGASSSGELASVKLIAGIEK